jgi:L-lactate dehydrogenase complex protein LldG
LVDKSGDALTAARNEVLARLRAALEDVPAGAPDHHTTERSEGADGDRVATFRARAADYRARIEEIRSRDAIAPAIRAIARRHRARRFAIPDDLDGNWLPGGLDVLRCPVSAAELDRVDGAITGCEVAVADTGTIVLTGGGSAQGSGALTLIPDLHICVVESHRIVAGLDEALDVVASTPRHVTLVSGPSATSDIELRRVEGVHGPRRLEVVIVDPRA